MLSRSTHTAGAAELLTHRFANYRNKNEKSRVTDGYPLKLSTPWQRKSLSRWSSWNLSGF
jgi:hypothetical protein